MDDEKFRIIYGLGLLITTILMIIFILSAALNLTFLFFFWVLRFLSGFGLILSIANGFTFLLDKFKDKLDKKQVNIIVTFEIIIPIILIIYSIYKIFSSIGVPKFSSEVGFMLVLDIVLFLYGIISLLLNLYIIQLVQEQFQDAVIKKRFGGVKSGAKKVGRKIKKKYFGWRKKYAKAQIQDQKTLTEMLELWQHKLAIYLLVPIGIASLLFTPIAFICIMFGLKIFVFENDDIKSYEKVALLGSMITIGIIACLAPFIDLPFYTEVVDYLWTMYIFYAIGISLATVVFIRRTFQLRGFSFEKIKDQLHDRKEEKIKEQKKEEKMTEKLEKNT